MEKVERYRSAVRKRNPCRVGLLETGGYGGFDVLGLEAHAYEAGGELLEAGDAGEDF